MTPDGRPLSSLIIRLALHLRREQAHSGGSLLVAEPCQRGRKSASSAFTWSGASSCIQWPGPSRRSYRQGPATFSAESVIWVSVRAGSPVLQTPMVGACTGGGWTGGAAPEFGG